MSIVELFEKIDNSEDFAFNAVKIARSEHYIGKNNRGCPVLILKTQKSEKNMGRIDMDSLHVTFNSKWFIRVDNCVTESVFSVLYLDSEETILQKYFVEIVEIILKELPQEPTVTDLYSCVMNLSQIFLARQKKPKKEAQGLWGELAVIYLSKSPETLLSAWHSDPESKVDFVCGGEMIEVKSTSSDDRRHHFSSGQLTQEEGIKELVASIIVRESGEGENGLSIEDLRESIQSRIEDDKLRMKLYDVIMNTLGNAYDHAKTMFFNMVVAKQSLKYYEANEIPHICKKCIPAGVTELGYVSNLDDCEDISIKMPSYDLRVCSLLSQVIG